MAQRKKTSGANGRPTWTPTKAERRLVMRRRRDEGAGIAEIAAELGVSAPTLRKHCPAELGLKVAAAAPAGRPEWQPTEEERERVATLRAGSMEIEDIARALGVTGPTLRKHCHEELTTGCARKRAEVVEALHKAAVGGNVSAQGKFLALVKEAETIPPPAPKPVRRGKKEQARIDAETAHEETTGWGNLVH